MSTLELFGLFIIFSFLFRFLGDESHQLSIGNRGFNKVPKLFLQLSNIDKDGGTDWDNLDETDKKKLRKYFDMYEKVSSVWLTFLYRQKLIFIQIPSLKKGYFVPTDKHQNELVREKIGELDEYTDVEFIIHRQKRGWFRSPVLTGYIRKSNRIKLSDKQFEIMFKFPEKLVNGNIFTKFQEKAYDLKKDTFADYMEDDLGNDSGYYYVTYDQELKNGSRFNFQVEP